VKNFAGAEEFYEWIRAITNEFLPIMKSKPSVDVRMIPEGDNSESKSTKTVTACARTWLCKRQSQPH